MFYPREGELLVQLDFRGSMVVSFLDLPTLFLWNLASRIGESSDDDVSILYHLCPGIIPGESSRFRIGFETNL